MTRAFSRMLMPALIAGSLVTAAPALAQSQGGPPPGGGRGASDSQSAAPSRVTSRVRRAEKALDRAEERIDDGDAAKAVAQLSAVRRALASASKSALKHVKTGDDAGPASVATVLAAEHDIVASTADNFDGQDGDVVTGLAATLKHALDTRDAAIAAITALSDSDQAAYADVLAEASSAQGDELDAIDEALSDDTLTDAAKSALTDARTQITATRKTVDARVTALGSSSSQGDDENADGPCDGGGRGPGAGGGSDGL